MRKFTKSLLTLALLVVGVGGAKAGVETVIKSIDYTTNPVTIDGAAHNSANYPFYSQEGWWDATDATAPTLNNGSLELVNAADKSYQLFIIDWATVKKGYGYKAKVTYKSTVAGSVNFSFGTWSTTLNKDGVAIEATDAWKSLLVDLGTANFEASASAHLFWKFSFAGTINIKKVEIIEVAPDVVYITEKEKFQAPTGTSDINGLTGKNTTWTITYPKEMTPGAGWNDNLDNDNKSVDISNYDYIHFVVTSVSNDANLGVRVFVSEEELSNNSKRHCLYPHPIADAANVTDWEAFSPITSTGTYVVKISDYPLLRGFKGGNGWQDGNAGTVVISQAYVSSGNAPVAYTPTGETTVYGNEYLADASVTCIDVTGLITPGQTLDAVNPNALFIANDGILTNTKNVIVNNVCANLELVDGKPFKAPAAFTATAAKFTKTVSAAGYGTMVIPFAASLPTGVKAYNLTGVSGTTITTSDAATIAANKPVLLEAAADDYEFTATSVSIAATDESSSNGLLNGTYVGAKAAADANNYVLQNGTNGLGFFLVTGIDADATVKPFRAYLNTGVSAPEFLAIEGLGITGIETVKATEAKGEFFNLAGQRVAQPAKGLYIVNGKKVIFK